METLEVGAIGCRVRLTVSGSRVDDAATAISDAWAWCIEDQAGPDDAVAIDVVVDDDAEVVAAARRSGAVAASNVQDMMQVLSQTVTVRCIDRQAGRLLMLHACGLADPVSGAAVAAVAASGTGKTTFARTLGKGRVYLSDETVALRDDLTVVPYPKPLSVSSATDPSLKNQIDPASAALVRPTGTYRLADLWFLERSAEAMTPTVEPMGTLDAIMAMVPQISHVSARQQPLQRLARTIDSMGGLKRVRYHEVADLEPFLDHALRSHR